MKVDVLAAGPIAPRELGGGGGGELHNAEVVSRLPNYGLEVAYAPYLSDLLGAVTDEVYASRLRRSLELVERRGVLVPSLAYNILEGEGARRQINSTKGAGRVSVTALRERIKNYVVASLKDPYLPDNNLKERLVRLAMALHSEVGDVKALISLTDLPSDFPIIAKTFKKPVYQVFHDNTFNVCLKPLNTARRLALLRTYVGSLMNLLSCVKLIRSFYSALFEGAPVSAVAVNPVSLAKFAEGFPGILRRFRGIHVLYPGNAIDQWALERASYAKEDYLIYGGHVSLTKGIYDLYHILRELASRRPKLDLSIIITGHVEDRTIINKLRNAYPHIKFLGFVNDKKELYNLYAGARALIYPSHIDGYSLTILDSLGTATPVVAYGIPVFVYLYRQVKPVRLVNEFDFRGFANELAKLAEIDNTEELFDDEKTQEFIRLHSSWDNVAEQYAKILSDEVKG